MKKMTKPVSVALSMVLAATATFSVIPAVDYSATAPFVVEAQAASTSWNMGDTAFKSLSTIKSNTTVDGLTLVATSSKTMSVKKESATVNGTSYKYCLALGGSGSKSYRAVSANVSGKSTIKITARSSGSSTRNLVVADSNGKKLASIACGSSAALGTATINYTGKVYIYSENSGINIYKVQIDSSSTNVEQTTEATTKATTTQTTTKKQDTSSSVSSGSVSWNMGDMAFRGLSSITSSTSVNGLTLNATSSKTMSVKSESASVGGTNFNYCLALGGSGSTSYRSVATNVSGKATVKITARSSGSSSRNLIIADSKGNKLASISCGSSAALGTATINYSGKIYIYSENSGINIYKIQIDGATSVEQTTEATTKTQVTTKKETTTKKENTTETTTKAQSSSSGSVKLSTPPSAIKTITSNSESELVAAIKEINSKGGTVYINTPVISVKSALKISGSKAGAIVGVQQKDGTYPRIDFSGQSYGTRGITISGSNQLIQNLIIEKSGDNGIWVSGAKNKIEHVIARYNNDSGIQLSDNANGNTLKYCYSYRNCDTKTYGANADGFAPKLGASNTVFEYCYAWDNSDDGWDSYDKAGDKSATVTYKHSACWNNGNPKTFTGEYDFLRGKSLDQNMSTIKQIMAADSSFASNYAKGSYNASKGKIEGKSVSAWVSSAEGEMNGNGFKFGSKTTEKSTSVVRTADYCVAFDHKSKGFDNNNSEGCTGYITNCVSFNNNINYQLPYKFASWSNNWSWKAKKADQSKQSQSLKTPSNVNGSSNTFYAVRDKIESTCNSNKMPDGVTFDSAINSLK